MDKARAGEAAHVGTVQSVDAGSGSESRRAGWCWQGASDDLLVIGHGYLHVRGSIYLSNHYLI